MNLALSFLKTDLFTLDILQLRVNFNTAFSISKKISFGNLLWIALNLWIVLSSMVMLTLLSPPIHEHEMSFFFFLSSLISFINVFLVFSI